MSPFSSGKVFLAYPVPMLTTPNTNNKLGKEKKKKMIARKKGYHGVTVASASMTGLPNQHKLFDLPQEHFIHTETPHYFKEGMDDETEADYLVRLTKSLEELIEKEGQKQLLQ